MPMGFTQQIVTPPSDRFFHAYRPKLKLLDDTLYVCSNTGIYRKNLRQNTDWELYAFDNIPIIEFCKERNNLLAISPGTKDGTDSLMFLSEDNGRTFKNYTSSHFFEEGNYNYPHRIIQNPQNPNSLLLYHSCYGLSKSENFGNSWQNLNDRSGMQNWLASFHPLDTTTIFYTGETAYLAGFIYKSIDNGLTWSQYIHPGGDNCIHHIAFHPTDPHILVYSGELTMGKSTDKGETWAVTDLYDTGMYFYKVLFDENNPANLYASGVNRKFLHDNEIILVYRSTDVGNSWHLAYSENLNMDCGGVLDMVKYENKLIFYTYNCGLFELDLNTIPLSIRTIDNKEDISIYPNPVQNTLYFNTEANIERIEIIDAMGRVIQKTIVLGNEKTVDVSKLNNGIYFAFFHAKGQKITKKIFINN
jgi:hypothetical protein